MYLDELSDIDSVRDRLPIDWAIEQLFADSVTRGHKVHGINPEHTDSKPSMHLWSPENDMILTHMYCLGCGFKGDVLDVIDLHYNSNGETVALSMDLLTAYENGGSARTPRVRDGFSQSSLELAWQEFQSDKISVAMISAFLMRKHLIGLVSLQWCIDEWRWLGSTRNRGCVAMPHFDSHDTLTGVKTRSTLNLDDKDGLAWSQYPELYGAWRDSKDRHIAICEGETDTVLASFILRNEPISVVGLGTGVSQNPTEQMKSMLAGRIVHLIFDADERGREAMSRWRDLLSDNIVIAHDLTEGDDVCTYKGSLLDVIGAIDD